MLVKYYSLNEGKQMMDLSIIPKKQTLIFLKKEEDLMFMETNNLDVEKRIKKFFWVKESEVSFIEEKEEDFSQEKINEREKILNEKWLDL